MKEADVDLKTRIEVKEPEIYFWIHKVFRKYVEIVMDVILVGLVIVTFVFITKTIYFLGISLYKETNIAYTISEIMFIFILIEVVRLLIIYLQFHKVATDTMVEIAIVSALRELILRGILEVQPIILVATSIFLIVLGLILKFSGIKERKELKM